MPSPTRWPERMFSSHSTENRAALEEIAEERGVAVSAVMREAVDFYLKHRDEKFAPEVEELEHDPEVDDPILPEIEVEGDDTEELDPIELEDDDDEEEDEPEPEPEPQPRRHRARRRGIA